MFVSQQAKRCIFYDASFRLRWRIFVFREEYKMKKLILSALSLTFILSAAFFASGCSKKDNHTHSFTQEIAEDKYLASEATCTEKARYYYSCNCGKAGKETFGYGSPLEHKLNNDNVCSFCGKSASEGLFFSLQGNEYTLIDIGTCEDTDIIIPKTYNGYPVSAIGDRAFADCSTLTRVTIPDSVISIRISAFGGCSELTSVTIPDSTTSIRDAAFYRCNKLASIILPNSLKSIGARAFEECSSLISITIPNGVTSIGNDAFSHCRELTTIILNAENCTNVNSPIFASCSSLTDLTIGDSVKVIPPYAFYGCSNITNIIIPNSVTIIGSYAFKECNGLTNIIVPDSVTSIGDSAFYGCSSLTSITIGNGVTSIGEDAFSYCSGLTSIIIPDGVTSIGDWAFGGCIGLTDITIPDGLTSIGDIAFNGCDNLSDIFITDLVAWCNISGLHNLTAFSIDKNLYLNNDVITNLVIPTGVTSISDYAFYGCNDITSITIGESVTDIGESAFSCCNDLIVITVADENQYFSSVDGNLYDKDKTTLIQYAIGKTDTSFIIPDGVTSIGFFAFKNCGSITSVTISASVTSMSGWAFNGCRKLADITVADDNPNFTSIDGNLYNKTGTKLIRYAMGKPDFSFVISDGVTDIDSSALSNCAGITSITIPDTVTTIGTGAFWGLENLNVVTWNVKNYQTHLGSNYSIFDKCPLRHATIGDSVKEIPVSLFRGQKELSSVIIGKSVTTVRKYAFYDCEKLKTVFYKGTAEQWNRIEILRTDNCLIMATRYYYSENKPSNYGNFWHYDTDGVTPVIW